MKGQSYNEKVDVFSFAIITFELLSSRVAMAAIVNQGDLDYEAVHAHAQETANGFRLPIPVDWPAPVRTLIEDCWAQKSSKRPSFATIERRLGELRVSELRDMWHRHAGIHRLCATWYHLTEISLVADGTAFAVLELGGIYRPLIGCCHVAVLCMQPKAVEH